MSEAKANNQNNGSTNRLVGWLISYQMDEKGKAFEIRSGRTLIGPQGANNGRLITVDSAELSSPHLAMKASNKHTIVVQDIFSDEGSFVLRSGSNEEKQVDGPIELKHGDWLRVGAKTRFQLCLIDGPTR